ncbi:anti-sigma factor domain-containing protein [Streptomyces sp. NPDC002888]|uniref:anti-sigma factor n=1 Tax=Streptomyces sp. NPDC002888 TaxID=3364668 RepID=UPI003682DDEE
MTTEEDPHQAVGAYVLHALPPAEEAVFENHLADCDQCRREVAELQETAARLGAAVESVPVTPQARARTLRFVAHTRQDGVRRHPRTSGHRVLRLALAASVAAAAALGGIAVWQHGQADDARNRTAQAEQRARTANAAITDVLTAPDATVHTGKLTGGSTAAVVVSSAQARAVFAAHGLPALAGGKVYELWYAAEAGDFRPAGLLSGTAESQSRVMTGSPAEAVGVGITVEPAGGSQQPTTEPLGIIPITYGSAASAPRLPQSAAELVPPALQRIEQAGSEALTSMRHMVGMLRDADGEVTLTPLAGIGEVRTLVEEFSAVGGARARLELEGTFDDLPVEVSTTAHRVVMEALTNVRKHAHGCTEVRVRVDRSGDRLTVRVSDDGRPRHVSQSGFGLKGLAERVGLIGGDVQAGPVTAGGWGVEATLPVSPAASPAKVAAS